MSFHTRYMFLTEGWWNGGHDTKGRKYHVCATGSSGDEGATKRRRTRQKPLENTTRQHGDEPRRTTTTLTRKPSRRRLCSRGAGEGQSTTLGLWECGGVHNWGSHSVHSYTLRPTVGWGSDCLPRAAGGTTPTGWVRSLSRSRRGYRFLFLFLSRWDETGGTMVTLP